MRCVAFRRRGKSQADDPSEASTRLSAGLWLFEASRHEVSKTSDFGHETRHVLAGLGDEVLVRDRDTNMAFRVGKVMVDVQVWAVSVFTAGSNETVAAVVVATLDERLPRS